MTWTQVAKKHGHIFCQRENCQCMKVDWDSGECTSEACIRHDPKYIAQRQKIEETMRFNYERHLLEKEKEQKQNVYIRNQSTQAERETLLEIKKLERIAASQRAKGHYITANKINDQANILRWQLDKK